MTKVVDRHPKEQSGNIRPSLAKKTPPSSNTDAHQKNTGSMKVNDYYEHVRNRKPTSPTPLKSCSRIALFVSQVPFFLLKLPLIKMSRCHVDDADVVCKN